MVLLFALAGLLVGLGTAGLVGAGIGLVIGALVGAAIEQATQ